MLAYRTFLKTVKGPDRRRVIVNLKLDSNKLPTRCNNFPVYYPDVYLELNMFRAFSRQSLGAQ
jgi:hypothetical protein